MKSGSIKRSKLIFGDLATSEKINLRDTAASIEKVREMKAITMGQTALCSAINHLSKGRKASFRSSSLTWILQDSVAGNCKTTIIAAVSQHIPNRMEMIRTVRFVKVARQIAPSLISSNNSESNGSKGSGDRRRRRAALPAMNILPSFKSLKPVMGFGADDEEKEKDDLVSDRMESVQDDVDNVSEGSGKKK